MNDHENYIDIDEEFGTTACALYYSTHCELCGDDEGEKSIYLLAEREYREDREGVTKKTLSHRLLALTRKQFVHCTTNHITLFKSEILNMEERIYIDAVTTAEGRAMCLDSPSILYNIYDYMAEGHDPTPVIFILEDIEICDGMNLLILESSNGLYEKVLIRSYLEEYDRGEFSPTNGKIAIGDKIYQLNPLMKEFAMKLFREKSRRAYYTTN